MALTFGTSQLGFRGGNVLNPKNYELGLSEAAAGIKSLVTGEPVQYNPQSYGSDIFGNTSRQSSASTGGQILGQTNTQQTPQTFSDTPIGPTRPTTVTTASGTPTSVVTDANSAIDKYKQALEASRVSPDELNQIFDPQFASLNAAEQLTQQNRDFALSNLDKQFGINRDQLESQVDTANAELVGQEESANKRALSSEAAARRLYNELNQANQQRFGNASSAGQAASELQGREFQRNQGDIRSALQETIQTINTEKNKIQENYTNAVKELMFNLETAKMNVQQQFNDAILNINQNRNMLETQKREARLNELQSYRDQLRQLNFEAISFEEELRNNATVSSQTLDQQLMAQAEALGISADQLMNQYENSPLAYNTSYGITDPGTTNTNPALTGEVSDEELLAAQGIRTRNNEDALTPLTQIQPNFVA